MGCFGPININFIIKIGVFRGHLRLTLTANSQTRALRCARSIWRFAEIAPFGKGCITLSGSACLQLCGERSRQADTSDSDLVELLLTGASPDAIDTDEIRDFLVADKVITEKII